MNKVYGVYDYNEEEIVFTSLDYNECNSYVDSFSIEKNTLEIIELEKSNKINTLNENILLPLMLAEYYGYDNEDDLIIEVQGNKYKEINLFLFIENYLETLLK